VGEGMGEVRRSMQAAKWTYTFLKICSNITTKTTKLDSNSLS
jgi:hypothetical protein